jgi:hypothetical protein
MSLYIPESSECIGSGLYSTVHDCPSHKNRVVKINYHRSDRINYLYLKWCMEEPALWKPKVYSLTRLPDVDGFIAVMKRYHSVTSSKKFNEFKWSDKLMGYQEEICRFLTKNKMNEREWEWDLHMGNIMLDGDNFVLTDPICEPQ